MASKKPRYFSIIGSTTTRERYSLLRAGARTLRDLYEGEVDCIRNNGTRRYNVKMGAEKDFRLGVLVDRDNCITVNTRRPQRLELMIKEIGKEEVAREIKRFGKKIAFNKAMDEYAKKGPTAANEVIWDAGL